MFQIISLLLFSITLFGKEGSKEEKTSDVAKISEAFGHLIGKNIETIGVDLDLTYVIKGLQDAAKGIQSPLSEVECVQAISQAQEIAYKKLGEKNLVEAERFLEKNAKNKNIVSLEKGKIQYKVEKQGQGALLEPQNNLKIKYVGKYLDGSVFGSSDSQTISLEETIPGFSKGLVGMKEGEKRILYIHPEYGYGTSGFISPNSLLTFEIELITANVQEEIDPVIVKKNKENEEFISPTFERADVR